MAVAEMTREQTTEKEWERAVALAKVAARLLAAGHELKQAKREAKALVAQHDKERADG